MENNDKVDAYRVEDEEVVASLRAMLMKIFRIVSEKEEHPKEA